MGQLISVEGPLRGTSFDIHAGATIGRSRTCAVRLNGRHISRVHARFEPRGDALAIVDVDSRNGIFVNGTKTSDHTLKKNDHIEIGEHVLVFDPSLDRDPSQKSDSPPPKPSGTAPKAGATATSILDTLIAPFPNPKEIPDADLRAECERLCLALETARQLESAPADGDPPKAFLERLMTMTASRRGFLMLADTRGKMKAAARFAPSEDEEFYVSNVVYHQLYKERRALIALDVARRGPQKGQPLTVLCVPLISRDALAGLVYLDAATHGSPPAPAFTPRDLRVVAAVCGAVAPILSQMQMTSRAIKVGRAAWKRLEEEAPLVTVGGVMKEVAGRLDALATLEVPVLIVGEPGTGRTTVARSIHYRGSRAPRPFVPADCSRLQPDVLEMARGGTLLLSEVGELPPDAQTAVLRAISESPPNNIRVVASTSGDLDDLVRKGTFMKELQKVLSTEIVRLPPLRERKGDLLLLIGYFLRVLGARQSGKLEDHVKPEVIALLEAHAWPGNVRELRNTIERMILNAGSRRIGPEHIPTDLVGRDIIAKARHVVTGDIPAATLMADLERTCLEEALKRVGGNESAAAELLGVSRSVLSEKLKTYQIKAGP